MLKLGFNPRNLKCWNNSLVLVNSVLGKLEADRDGLLVRVKFDVPRIEVPPPMSLRFEVKKQCSGFFAAGSMTRLIQDVRKTQQPAQQTHPDARNVLHQF